MTDTTSLTPMADSRDCPWEVAEAILKVSSQVETLERNQEAQNGRTYKFAGIEAFYEEVRPLCADAGLIIVAQEESVDFRNSGRGPVWLLIRYGFTLVASVQGQEREADPTTGLIERTPGRAVTWRSPVFRTIMVEGSMGSQAFGAAQSYASKMFMRDLFKISTGDAEDEGSFGQGRLPDHVQGCAQERQEGSGGGYEDMPGEMGPEPRQDARGGAYRGPAGQDEPPSPQTRQQAPAARQQGQAQRQGQDQGARKSAAQAKRDGDWEALLKSMYLQGKPEELEGWRRSKQVAIEALPGSWQAILREKFRDHKAWVEEKAAERARMGQPGGSRGDAFPGDEPMEDGLPPGETGSYAAQSGR